LEFVPVSNTAIINKSLQTPIIKFVDNLLAIKSENPNTTTTSLEREIDKLVYQLYGLTEEEIAIVEGTVG
jgi:hypothetical protein